MSSSGNSSINAHRVVHFLLALPTHYSYMLFLKAQKISEFDKVVLVKAVGMFSGSIFDYTFRGLGPSGSKQNPMGTCFYDCYEKKAYTGLALW